MGQAGRDGRPLRVEPLWVRVDRNRIKLAVFVATFLGGSATLIGLALVAVPGSLFGLVLVGPTLPPRIYFARLAALVVGAICLLLVIGGVLAAVQLSNAEDWVRNRFRGGDFRPGSAPWLESAVHDMSLAAGLPAPPRLLWLDTPSVNACAIGMSRDRPVLGFTRGFFDVFTEDEQRAVVATMIARITAGDILFGTALAALMGPIKAIRGSGRSARRAAGAMADMGGGCALDGCADGCGGGCVDFSEMDDMSGCGVVMAAALFAIVVATITYLAVRVAAWIVTIWGRLLHRTSHEKSDAEGMLLLKDPAPMLSALGKAIGSSNEVTDGDSSYDGILYAPTSGTPAIDKVERRRYDRLREVLGTEGLAAGLHRRGLPPL